MLPTSELYSALTVSKLNVELDMDITLSTKCESELMIQRKLEFKSKNFLAQVMRFSQKLKNW